MPSEFNIARLVLPTVRRRQPFDAIGMSKAPEADMAVRLSFTGRRCSPARVCCVPLVQLVSYANGISALVLETLVLSQHYQRAGGHRQGITDGAGHIVFRPNA